MRFWTSSLTPGEDTACIAVPGLPKVAGPFLSDGVSMARSDRQRHKRSATNAEMPSGYFFFFGLCSW